MNTENMKLWDAVEKTDPKHTKKANIGGMKITAIAPQYQILKATEQFGPYAIKWGFKNIEFDWSLVPDHKLVIFKGTFFCPDGECVVTNSAKLFMDRAEKMIDADIAKKLETDALTKVLSKMGFNADVFMGRYDDNKYVEQMTREHAPKPMTKERAIELLTQAIDEGSLRDAWKQIATEEVAKDADIKGLAKARNAELTTK
jgi:uncharacterized short protein YbdD (DUF466 family)